jgi:hypothetical protein
VVVIAIFRPVSGTGPKCGRYSESTGDFGMVSSEYFRRQAALCLRLAATVKDKKIAGVLVAMADDFSDRADEVDPSLKSTSPGSLGSNGDAAMAGRGGGPKGRQPKW